jgi:hypothetical protein
MTTNIDDPVALTAEALDAAIETVTDVMIRLSDPACDHDVARELLWSANSILIAVREVF